MLAAAVLLSGCAQIGPVEPPSAGLPAPVTDFKAVRSGNQILIAWTPPQRTSDGGKLRGVSQSLICAWPGNLSQAAGAAPPTSGAPAGPSQAAVPEQVPAPRPRLPLALASPSGEVLPACVAPLAVAASAVAVPTAAGFSPEGWATLAVRVANARGEAAGWSNLAVVPLTPAPLTPALTAAQPTPEGVALVWTPADEPVEVWRASGEGAPLAIATAIHSPWLDTSVDWKASYRYTLRGVAGRGALQVATPDSNLRAVAMSETPAPGAPAGLEAVAAPDGGGADLSWDSSEVRDLAGYNVYRQTPGGGWVKLTPTPLVTPVYHDAGTGGALAAGYAVTAVDLLGQESARSSTAVPR